MQVVEPPQRVQPLHLRLRPLLPVQPPEIHPVRLGRVVQQLKVRRPKLAVRNVKRHRLHRLRVDPRRRRHPRILLLVREDAVRRVQVQRRPQPLGVQPVDQPLRVGKQLAVPRVPRPPHRLVARLDDVPVHVDDAHRQRHFVRRKLLHQPLQLLLGVRPEAAPPVPQQPARDQRRRPGNLLKVLQAPHIVVPVAKEIEVQVLRRRARHQPALLVKDQRPRVVHDRPPAARHQPRLQRHKPVRLVQRPRRPLQVARLPDMLAKVPRIIRRLHVDRQAHRRKPAGRRRIPQHEMWRLDRHHPRALRHRKLRYGLAAKPERLARLAPQTPPSGCTPSGSVATSAP